MTLVIAWVIILAGVGLRLRPYQANRSLWRDESSLSYNLVTKNFHDLIFKTLDFNQAAPVGFLTVEKLAVMTFGTGERALRLFPLAAGILSLPLFFLVARRVLSVRGTLVALTLFALSQPLIYYAAEVKQFGIDVAWVLAILLFALRFQQDGKKGLDLAGLAIIGLLSVWFSHPAIFMLAGVGLALFIDAVRQGQKQAAMGLIGSGVIWVGAFAVNWFIFLRMVREHEYLKFYWHDKVKAFPPLPSSMKNLEWYMATLTDTWDNPMGLPAAGLAAAACVIGIIWLWREDRKILGILGFPVLFTLFAAIVQQYPFQDRMILFLSPMVLILVAGGVSETWRGVGAWRLPAGAVMFVLIVIQPLYNGARNFIRPPIREEFRPVIAEVARQIQPGDTVYLYEGAIRAFHYYTNADRRYALPEGVRVIEGVPEGQDWNVYRNDLEQVRGKPRVWILFTHVYKWKDVNEQILYLDALDKMGKRLETLPAPGGTAAGYLYDLAGPVPTDVPVQSP
jgi:hypothetical protein